jgi:hypothetical protein
MEKNKDDYEQPISFMSKTLRDVELKCTITENKSYSLSKSLKHFRGYVGYKNIKAYVSYPVVKDTLNQQDCLGTRGKWVSKIQENQG